MPTRFCESCQVKYYERPDGLKPHSCTARKKGRKGDRKPRVLRRCAWLDCTEMVPVVLLYGADGSEMYRMEISFGKARHPICKMHRDLIDKHLGLLKKRNGIRAALAHRNGKIPGRITAPLTRLMIFLRDDEACRACKRKLAFSGVWHIDHAVPSFDGGVHEWNNLQVLCVQCHAEKTRDEQSRASKIYWNNLKRTNQVTLASA